MKKNTLTRIFTLILFFLVALPWGNILATEGNNELTTSSVSGLGEDLSKVSPNDRKKYLTNSGFEQVVSEYFITAGDYALKLLNKIFGEEITIDKLVFNETKILNANFFSEGSNPGSSSATEILRDVVNKWFGYFRGIVIVVILISLIAIGIQILLQTTNAKVNAMENFKKVIMATVLIFFFPYVMKYAFEINEGIVGYIAQNSGAEERNSGYSSTLSPYTNLQEEDLEFRSPKYVTGNRTTISVTSDEATQMYINKAEEYGRNFDVMRLMRAYAGVTLRFVYVVLWYIMLAQTIILSAIYIKRYITIAFLISIYPLVIIGYVVGGMFGRKENAFNRWCKTFFTSVFLQTIHAVVYGVITSIVVSQVKDQLSKTPGQLNVILLIIATSFLFSGEKIISRLWKASIDATERAGLKNMFKGPKKMLKNFRGK